MSPHDLRRTFVKSLLEPSNDGTDTLPFLASNTLCFHFWFFPSPLLGLPIVPRARSSDSN